MKVNPLQQGKRANPLDNFLFFKVMGEKGNEEQLLSFLNAVLTKPGEGEYISTEITENTALPAEFKGDKSGVLDVIAVLSEEIWVNVEVQLRNRHNMEKRSLFYWSRLFSKTIGKGMDYRELSKVVSINIVDYEFIPAGGFHTCFHLWEDEIHWLLTDELEIHFIDMVKWRKLDNKDVVNNPLHRWLAWLDQSSPPELISEVVDMDRAIQKAEERRKDALKDMEAWLADERRLKAQMDWTTEYNIAMEEAMEQGFAKGEEKGLEQGLEKEQQKSVRNLHEYGMAAEQIALALKLPLEKVMQYLGEQENEE